MFEIDKEQFGGFVAQLRKEKGLMQKELAEKLYVSDKAVSKWERGLSIPDVTLLVPLAEILGVTVTELLECRRLPKDAPASSQTEELVKKVIGLSEEERRRYRPDRGRRGVQLAVCAAVGCVEIWLLTCLGYSLADLASYLLTVMGLMAGFGLYFCVFARERLPEYYDQHRISAFSDGILRMNLPGVNLNNRNWPHIVRAGQLWALNGLPAAPAVFYLLDILIPQDWISVRILLVLAFTLGGLFVPMVYVGRKYELAPDQPRPVKHTSVWIWICGAVLAAAALIWALSAMGFSGSSGVRVMWSESRTANAWSASYAYHDGYVQTTANKSGDPCILEVEIETVEGTIGLTVTDEHDRVVFSQTDIPTSSFAIGIPGTVRVRVESEDHKGSFFLKW